MEFFNSADIYLFILIVVLLLLLTFFIALNLKSNSFNKELKKHAYTDNLTGIMNRYYFMKLALIEEKRAIHSMLKCFTVIFDLDHFKQINDTYGHAVGDKILTDIASRVKFTLRSDDLFARYGGEEFIIFLSDVDENFVADIIERIRLYIAEIPFEVEGNQIRVSASFGVAIAYPLNDLETSTKLADRALYQAKENGRNKVLFYNTNIECFKETQIM